jgi:CRP/FNR family transcriptional regulator, anaerobic regulatory protein
MINDPEIEKQFKYLGQELIDEILKVSVVKVVPKKAELIREGDYVKVLPIVLKGLVKVFVRQEDKELLLYYIQPNETCIMSFSACLKNEKSKVYAISEEESRVVLVPADKILRWIVEYPRINQLFYQQYDQRYSEMIDTINHLLFDKLDKRILGFLMAKSTVTGKNPLKISHKDIANELGTAREVVSRLIKKLEKENKVKQHSDSIEIF